MATSTSAPPSTSTTAAAADGAADSQGGSDPLAGDPPAAAQLPAAAAPPADPTSDDSRSSDPLKAQRRKNNQLEKEIRTLRQQLNRFSEINPEEYARLQEAERQKQVLEERMELRERQMGLPE